MYDFIEILDGKDISETSRQFLRNWQANKEAKKHRKELTFQRSSLDDGWLKLIGYIVVHSQSPFGCYVCFGCSCLFV